MKTIKRIRIKNPYFLCSLIALLLCLGISWFFESTFAEIVFFMDYDAPDLVDLPKDEIRKIMLDGIMCWEIYIDSAMRYLVDLFPLFAIIPTIPFLREYKSYFIFGTARFKNHNKSVLHAIFIYALQGGLCISVAFVIYFSIGSFFMVPTIENISGFAAIFPQGFYMEHPYLFFVFMSTTIYFLIGFVFAGLACALALWTKKEFLIIILPLVIYILDSYLGSIFRLQIFQLSSSVIAFNTVYSTFETFIPLIPFAIFGFSLIIVGLRRRRKGIVI